jgi:LysR family transcriptional regulator, benzoate and cis,cis-muconate-responsive activator of ben and cat genes
MELRHLRYFVAVADELNFRKASERLRVAQPALSTQIHDLEDELEVKLFDRDTGGVRLTDAGAAFLIEARQILGHAQQAVTVAREASKGRRGRITVGYIAPLLVGFMPEGLKKFNERYPGVDVTLVEMPISDQLAGLEAGTVQVGFTIKDIMPVPSGLHEIEVARSPIGVIMGPTHRLARARQVAMEDVAREPLLSLSVKKGWTIHAGLIRKSLAVRGLQHGPIRAVEGTENFRALLESGLGVSIVAEMGSLSRSRDLRFRHFKESGDDLVMVLHALWREGESSQIARNFVALLREINGLRPAGITTGR